MNFSKQTLLHRFWSRVFDSPTAPAMVLRAKRRTEVVVSHVAGAVPASVSVPGLTHVDWEGQGYAVATIRAYLAAQGIGKGDRVAILGWNSPEWTWADIAIQSLGAVAVAIYPHSSPEQVNYVVADSGSKLVLTNEREQLKKVSGVPAVHFNDLAAFVSDTFAGTDTPFVDWFVASDFFGCQAKYLGSFQGVVKAQFDEIRAQLTSEDDFLGVGLDDLAMFIYTSGSTGQPKGACLSHGNISAACQSLIAHGFEQRPGEDLYLSYLPLAHVYERIDGTAMALWNGTPIAFCKVDEVGDALKLYRPSVLCGVPAVWRKMKDKITGKLEQATGIKRCLINWALSAKTPGFKRWLADKLIFSKIRAELGGSLRLILSGGAPISPDVIEFFNLIGLELLQGYGLTETAGGITTNRPSNTPGFKHNNKVGSVGQVVPGVEVRIVPEPGEENSGQGEIWIRGPLVFRGYWKLDAENAKVLTADGWFKTGDLGRIDADGFLFITGRKKRLLKTEGGKYVAPEKIEKAFETESLVQYVVPVGDGKPFISALLFVNQLIAREKLGRAIPAGVDAAAYIAEQPEIVKAVEAAVAAANAKLERHETLKKFKLMPVEATIANGLLTPTLKIRSEEAAKRFKADADAFYVK